MGKKQSSFHIADEINGYGEERYLKGTQPSIHPPISQENVYLTADFGNHLLTVLGSMPVVISPLAMNPALLALLGSMASVNRAIITIDEATGNYILQFNIISPQDLTDGSSLFLHYIMDNKIPIAMGVPGKWEQHGSQWKYLENGSYLKHTWRKIEGLWYYFHSDGVMASRQWIKTGGKWYFTHSKGNMAIDQWIEDGKRWYYVGRDGVMVSNGRKEIKGKWYFFKTDGSIVVNDSVWDPVSGKTHYADENGELTEGAGQPMVFQAVSWLGLAEGNFPYIYSTKDPSYSQWTGGFSATADLTFGIGHSIQTIAEFNTISKFIANHNAPEIAAEVKRYLQKDIASAVTRVNDFMKNNNVILTQNQFDAIVSLVFNYPAALSRLSDLGIELINNSNSGNFNQQNIIVGFTYTVFQGNRIDGLVTRRNNELNLFFNADYNNYYDSKLNVINAGIEYIQY